MGATQTFLFVLCGLFALASFGEAAFPDNVFVWGSNANAELGFNNGGVSEPSPLQLFPVLEGTVIAKSASGEDFTLLLTASGDVYFTGSNAEFAACNNQSYSEPTLILTGVADIAAGSHHAVYLFDSDLVWICGLNANGQLGTVGASETVLKFNSTLGTTTGVVAGEYHSFVYGSGVLAVGANDAGQLGLGFSGAAVDVTQVAAFFNVTILHMAAGSSHSLLVTIGNTPYGTGDNSVGQLGLGTTIAGVSNWTALPSPPSVQFVAANGDNSIFLTTAATNNVFGTGLNDNSQLSTGDRKTRFRPVRSNGGFVTEQVQFAAVGRLSTALVTASRRVFMSGDNSEGQLGLGDFSLRANAVFVDTLPCEVVSSISIYSTSTIAVLNGGGAVPTLSMVFEEELLVDDPFVIPHAFTPALNDYFLVVRYEVDGPAVLDNAVASFGECDQDEVIVTCTGIGLVTITATSFGLGAESVFKIPCHGTVELDGLQSIALGGSVTPVIRINPPAVSQFDFEITTANHFIAIPSHSTVSFAAGQSSAAITLTSPANGKIGITSGYIAPSITNTYQYVSFSLAVTGFMSSSVVTECPSVGLPVTLRVDVDPQAPREQEIVLELPSGFNASETFVVPNGQRFGTVDVIPTAVNDLVTAEFSTTLYSGSSTNFTVLSSFFTDFETEGAVRLTYLPITIELKPVNTQDVDVFIVATNLEIANRVEIPAGAGRVTIDSTPLLAGRATLQLSADGFCTRTFTRTISAGVECSAGFLSNADGSACARCPTISGNICSARGECDFSLCIPSNVLCHCTSAFFGSACQYTRSDIGKNTYELPLTSSFQSTSLEFNDGTVVIVSAPSGIINGTEPAAYSTIQGVSFQSGAAHLGSTSSPPTDGIATPYGLDVDATCDDNAGETRPFLAPIQVTFTMPLDYPQRDFLQLRPFKLAGSQWVSAPANCREEPERLQNDLISRTLTFEVCDAGQYHLFIIDPEAFGPVISPPLQMEGRPVETTTGVTGFQPGLPPDPQFSPNNRPGEVLRSPISFSEGSALSPALVCSVLLALVSLILA